MTPTELALEPMALWECTKCEFTIEQPLPAYGVTHVPVICGVRRAAHPMRRVLPGPHTEANPGRTTVAQHP